jgi:hypothetical protein
MSFDPEAREFDHVLDLAAECEEKQKSAVALDAIDEELSRFGLEVSARARKDAAARIVEAGIRIEYEESGDGFVPWIACAMSAGEALRGVTLRRPTRGPVVRLPGTVRTTRGRAPRRQRRVRRCRARSPGRLDDPDPELDLPATRRRDCVLHVGLRNRCAIGKAA